MKLKKKAKKILLIIILLLIVIIVCFLGYKSFTKGNEIKETKVLQTINSYGYKLKDNKSKRYQQMFSELDKILTKDTVNEEEYVKKITEMFIYDFYTLDNKTAKTDVGGIDFVYSTFTDNFLENAEDTYYKYVESNIYNQRKQKLPEVDEITIKNVEKSEFAYEEKIDESAYVVNASWTYLGQDFNDYQSEATLTFVHEGKKLSLVELK